MALVFPACSGGQAVRVPEHTVRLLNPFLACLLQEGEEPTMRYKVALHQSEEGFSVWVPGLPGCVSQGETEAEALANIADAIREYLAVVMEQLEGAEIREIEIVA